MKIRKRDNFSPPQANKIFTDREEPRLSFWKVFERVKGNIFAGEDISVLTYYGIGGIGKTSLLRQLMSEMDEKIKRPLYAYVDLNIRQELSAVLDSLKNILAEKYNFSFPLFDLAVYVYSKKIGEKIHEDETAGLIEKSPFLGTIMEVLDEIPFVGILKKLDKCAGYVKSLIEKRKREVNSIDTDPVDVIYKKLPYYFALDLSDNLEHTNVPLVVFLDTYEVLVNEMAGTGEPVNNDLWIRGENGLIQNSSRVMWVIAGREKLRWAEINPDWSDSLEQHILGNLSLTDARSFLNTAGIYDEKLTEAIYNLTSGTPVFLDLCVDNYYSIIERGKTPEIEDFNGNTTVIIERFLRYMDDNRKDIIYLLSCIKIWDDEIFHSIAGEVISGFSFTTYEKIKGASFITKGSDGTFTMHQTVQSVIYSNCPSFIREKAQESLNRYYENALKNINVTSPKLGVVLPRYVSYVTSRVYSEEEFCGTYEQLRKRLDDVQTACQFDLLLSCMNGLKDYAQRNMPDTPIMAKIYNDIAKDFEAAGRYDDALENARLSEKICREIFGNMNARTFEAVDTVSRCLYLVGKYQESYEAAEQVYSDAVVVLGEDNPIVLLLLKEIGTGYQFVGKYDEALKFKQELVDRRKKLLGEEHPDTLTALLNLGNAFNFLRRYQEAAEIFEHVLEKRIELFGENHPDVLNAMNSLAISYSKLGELQRALELREKVLEICTELLGESHPDTLVYMGNLANSYSKLGQLQKALDLCEKVLEKRTELLGENHPDTLMAMNNLANSYSRLGQLQKALELHEKVLEKRTELLGENHPDTLGVMNNLVILYSKLGQLQKALELRKKIFEKRMELLGEAHPDTLGAMNNLADNYNRLGDYESALSLAQKTLAMQEKIIGKEDVNTGYTADTVAEALSGLGHHEEAIKMQEEACRILSHALGETHWHHIEYLENLATRLKAADEFERAVEVEAKIKNLREKSQEQTQV
ncbi:MAG: tetratricopeptide repeat protein [Synergistaceae bacterium]|nr:tetratricopeptide repeat protein [Synergistaceae bacterium]